MSATALLKANIAALLRARKVPARELAQWCRQTESWMSKALNVPSRQISPKYYDRIADFFGIQVHELFTRGISDYGERRTGTDRRVSGERRIGHAQREVLRLASVMREFRPTPRVEVIAATVPVTAAEQRFLERIRTFTPAQLASLAQVLTPPPEPAKPKALTKKVRTRQKGKTPEEKTPAEPKKRTPHTL